MRSILNTGHQVVTNIMRRARLSLYWPNIGKELTYMSEGCGTCNKYQNQQKQETKLEHEIPNSPWIKVGADCFSVVDKDYLIVVDYTIKYFEVCNLKNKESKTIVRQTKEIFTRFGILLQVFSDNGPEFIAKEYYNFSIEWDFEHETSSPEYPESNGRVERTIQTVKKTLKAFNAGDDPNMAILILKTTPLENGGPSEQS